MVAVRRYMHAVISNRGRVAGIGESEADAWLQAEASVRFTRAALRRIGYRCELRDVSTLPAFLLPSARVIQPAAKPARTWRWLVIASAFLLALVLAIINYGAPTP